MKAKNGELKRLKKYLFVMSMLLFSGVLPLVSQPNLDEFAGNTILKSNELNDQDPLLQSVKPSFRYSSPADKNFNPDLLCTEEEVDRRSSFKKIIKTTVIEVPHFFATVFNSSTADTPFTCSSNFRQLSAPSSFRSICIPIGILRL